MQGVPFEFNEPCMNAFELLKKKLTSAPIVVVKGVRSFLGHIGFYRWFIQDFSKVSNPLFNLLMQGVPFEFNEPCMNAFELLKKKLTLAPIVVAPDWNLPFELMCNVSDFAVRAVIRATVG